MDGDAKGFEFRGNAKEWFGIWIVNLLLTIVTIGIYSAWAKVRTKKYFYNNTYVEGRNFDYHATGKQILIGRLIVIAAFIVISVLAAIPILNIVVILGLLAALPWLLVKSMMFNARMSSFSNVRFDFIGTYGGAFKVFVLAPVGAYLVIVLLGVGAGYLIYETGSMVLGGILGLVAVVVMFLLFPYIDRMVKNFTISNHKLGVAGFEMNVAVGPFIKAAIFAAIWVVVVLAIGGFLFGGTFMAMFATIDAGGEPTPAQMGMIGILYLFFFVAFLPAAFIYQALIRNVVYDNTTLEGGHRFRSTVSAKSLLWIAISNMIVVVFTLGLMLPWAQVRMVKYLADNTGLIPGGDMDSFIGEQQQKVSALGDAYSDIEGIEVGLPL